MPPTLLTLAPPDAEWMARAACSGYWDVMESAEERDQKVAKDLCASCPVWQRCRSWTLSLPPSKDVCGVAGGLTEDERQKARRRVRRSRPLAPEPPRECTCCGETKVATEFYQRPDGRGGREGQCRACKAVKKRERRAAQREAVAS